MSHLNTILASFCDKKLYDKTKISLSDLAFTPERDDNIQLFDQDGNVKESFTYCRKGNKTDGYTFYWENLEGNEISAYDFPRGSSLWINTASQIEFTQSGAVQKEPTIIEIPGDGAFAQAGNNTPVDIKLSQLVFSNINRDDNIQIFDKDGNVSDALTYCRKGNKTDGYTFYWEDLEGTEVDATKYNFSPGQVFWANCAEAGTLTIPAPTF